MQSRPRGTHGLLIWIALFLPAQARAFEKTLPAAGVDAVEIEVVFTNVKITGWDKDEIKIQGDRKEPRMEVKASRLEIAGEKAPRKDACEAMQLVLPRRLKVELRTVSGQVQVSGMQGKCRLVSVSGDVAVDGAQGGVEANTVSGDLSLRASTGDVETTSVSGDIELLASRRTPSSRSRPGPTPERSRSSTRCSSPRNPSRASAAAPRIPRRR